MLKIVSVARTAGLVIFCSVFLHEEITLIEAVGYGISLLGFVWYNVIRYREGQQKEVCWPRLPPTNMLTNPQDRADGIMARHPVLSTHLSYHPITHHAHMYTVHIQYGVTEIFGNFVSMWSRPCRVVAVIPPPRTPF